MKLRNLKKSNAGFTLVELIVVIAIMAILAGVGTVGYSAYIKQANKKADMTTVGNIIRAIETGTYSTMFEIDDSFNLDSTQYPVGFVVLNTDGTTVHTSAATVNEGVADACHFERKKVYYAEKTTDWQCQNGITKPKESAYMLSSIEVEICTTHCNYNTDNELSLSSFPTQYSCKYQFPNHNHTATAWVTIPANNYYVNGSVELYQSSSNDSSKCAYAYANQYDSFTASNDKDEEGNPINTKSDTNNPIYNALEAAFGNLSNVKLTYTGWTNDEDLDIATVYSFASGFLSDAYDIANLLTNPIVQNILSSTGKKDNYLTGNYDDADDLLLAFASFVSENFTEESFVKYWDPTTNTIDRAYTFGINKENRDGKNDFIYAARLMYNSAFASYCQANKIDKTYTSIIAKYDEKNNLSIEIPVVVCSDTLKDSYESPYGSNRPNLKTLFKNAGDSDGTIFARVQKLYEDYKDSEACYKNAIVYYQTMQTLAATGNVATDKNNTASGDMVKFYQSYVDEIANIYEDATEYIKDGNIVIMVYVKNGNVECEVYPSAANPRND